MAFPARVFRILIASPSDVTAERDIAVRTIQEWNDLNASVRQIVLLPLRWETHSAPGYGKRPQEFINPIVDQCDLLVGVFWTRVGSPSGAADSGTIEEIERVATDGKPVMLYFSQVKQDPDKLELEQLSKLREFKKKTFPKALVENYADQVEFKDKLSKQIEIQLRSLLAEQSKEEEGEIGLSPVTDIILHFAEPTTGNDAGLEMTVSSKYFELSNVDALLDYAPSSVAHTLGGTLGGVVGGFITGVSQPIIQASQPNRDYYRQITASFVLQGFFRPLRFWLKNQGGVGARDVYIDINVISKSGNITLISKQQLPTSTPSKQVGTFVLSERHPTRPDQLIVQNKKSWKTQIEVSALQPQRELNPKTEYLIGATESCDVLISATIFADTLPEPSHQELKLRIEVEKQVIPSDQLLAQLIQPDPGESKQQTVARSTG